MPRGALPRRELSGFLREVREAIPLAGEVTALLTSDAAIQDLNRQFRRKNKPTDVLSFPAESLGEEDAYAGDLAVSLDTAARQAEACGHSLLLDGLLHLAGFDHEQDTGQMARKERLLRKRFELPLGLIQRTTEPAAKKAAGKATKQSKAESSSAKKSMTAKKTAKKAAKSIQKPGKRAAR